MLRDRTHIAWNILFSQSSRSEAQDLGINLSSFNLMEYTASFRNLLNLQSRNLNKIINLSPLQIEKVLLGQIISLDCLRCTVQTEVMVYSVGRNNIDKEDNWCV